MSFKFNPLTGQFDIVGTSGGGAVDSVNSQTGVVVLDTGDISSVLDSRYVTDAQLTVIGNTSGTNTGDQTSIIGISGTLAQFNTALSDADFATGGGTVIGASSGTNTGDQTSIVGISGTMSEFNTAVTDGNILFNDEQGLGFRFENRTSDPGTPTVGQVWLRTDL